MQAYLSSIFDSRYLFFLWFQFWLNNRISSAPPPPVFFTPPVTIYMLLYSTLLCKIARESGGGGAKDISWGQNRIYPKNLVLNPIILKVYLFWLALLFFFNSFLVFFIFVLTMFFFLIGNGDLVCWSDSGVFILFNSLDCICRLSRLTSDLPLSLFRLNDFWMLSIFLLQTNMVKARAIASWHCIKLNMLHFRCRIKWSFESN